MHSNVVNVLHRLFKRKSEILNYMKSYYKIQPHDVMENSDYNLYRDTAGAGIAQWYSAGLRTE
jgi:hypothetical protein